MEQNKTGYQTPSHTPILCVNNCGFFGTAATMNMCSKCYKHLVSNEQQAKLVASSIQSIVNGSSCASELDPGDIQAVETATTVVGVSDDVMSPSQAPSGNEIKQGPGRCGACKKRVGLTGFSCRCGDIFCAAHRHSDKHECSFDYRAAGREAIARANPVVKAEKLDKI